MSASSGVVVPGPMASEVEVLAKATRRRISPGYKLRILREADACTQPGELGALLRREGLYASNLRSWREQRELGELRGLTPKQRGPASKAKDPLAAKVAALEREVTRYKTRAERAEALVELQKSCGVPGVTKVRSDEIE